MLHTDMSVRTPPLPPVQLRDAWAELHRREPELRARDLAERLGVSEGELLASRCGEGVTRLEGPWPALLQALPALRGKIAQRLPPLLGRHIAELLHHHRRPDRSRPVHSLLRPLLGRCRWRPPLSGRGRNGAKKQQEQDGRRKQRAGGDDLHGKALRVTLLA